MAMNYFKPTGMGETIFSERYAYHPEETWEEACARVARHIAAGEDDDKRKKYEELFEQILLQGKLMPGGRIWYGSGRKKGNLLNCYVIPIADSKEGWGKALYDSTVISCTGGGVGMNASSVRPRGAKISGHGGEATGPLSIFKMINGIGDEIKAGGTRRVALMQCLNLDHPDILDFLCAKLDLNELNNANISAVFMNEAPEDFFDKVTRDEEIELKFNGDTYRTIRARELWDKIVENGLKNGEPGVLNGYYANRDSNVQYDTNLISTNPCGEIWLSPYENCCLGALVLPRFITDNGEPDWEGLREAVHVSVRFLDNVLTVNYYPMKENQDASEKYRRVGLGIMGLHDFLLLQGIKYSEGYDMVDRVMRFIRNEAYMASSALAAEKGSFPKFDADKVLKAPSFASRLPSRVKNMIRQYGLRNCAILTIAPTGTTSMVQGVSSGIEPMFAPAYLRRRFVKDDKVVEVMVHPLVEEFLRQGLNTDHFEGAQDLTPRQHLQMQAICQKYVDNAVSKTINIPQGIDVTEFSNILMEYIPQLKGLTVYPVGSRGEEPLTPISLQEALKQKFNTDDEETIKHTLMQDCSTGVCTI